MTTPSARAHDIDLSGVTWRKSSYSSGETDCVETGFLPDDRVVVRDSKHPDGAVLVYTPGQWSAFLKGAKAGEFD